MLKITAPREFSPLEEICTLTPFIERLSRKFKDVACECCFKRHRDLKSCTACSEVKYCGKECQKKDWKNHKLECQKLKYLPQLDYEIPEADTVRLIGSTILKIKGKDWKNIKSNILGMDVSFDDIDANVDISDTYRQIFYDAKEEYTRKYIGDVNMPNKEDFKKIVGKVRKSLYQAPIPEQHVTTLRFILEISFFSNECIPNCHYITKEGINVFKAIKKIEKHEKLSIRNVADIYLRDDFGFDTPCNCTDCRLPYGESVLSKIKDKGKALAVILATQQFLRMWYVYRKHMRMPDAINIVNGLLQKHEGVLGDTNILHLRLLAVKCFDIGDHPLEAMKNLLKLEKNTVTVFGEYAPQLFPVYDTLCKTLFSMGNIEAALHYLQKGALLLKEFPTILV